MSDSLSGRTGRLRALSALTLFALAACGSTPEPDAAPAAAMPDTALLGAEALAIADFTFDTVQRTPWTASALVPARVMLNPAREQTLGSIVEGRVTHVFVRVGDRVSTGQVLVAIHSHEIMDARAGLVRAESEQRSALAERDLALIAQQRAERLVAAKAMSAADLERANTAATAASAHFEAMQAELVRAQGLMEHLLGDGPLPAELDPHDVLIRSPISGTVVQRSVTEGTVVLPGDPLVAVADPRALQLELRLTDRQVAGLANGSSLSFTLVGDGDDAPAGRAVVSRISPVADEATRTTMVVADLVDTPPGTRAERFATARLAAGSGESVIQVPTAAIQALAGDTIVVVAEQRGEGLHIAAVPVRLGRRSADFTEVIAGLESGRVVIVRGATIARAELLRRRGGDGGE